MTDFAPPPKVHFKDTIRLFRPAEKERARVLLFHGLTGTPSEMEGLASSLHEAGCSVIAPLLPGHGRSISELRRTSMNAWRASAKRHFNELCKDKPANVPIFIVGLSMGSLLGLGLAAVHPDQVRGVVLLSPPLKIRSRSKAALLELLSYLPGPAKNFLGVRPKTRRPIGYLLSAHNAFPEHSTASLARLFQLRRKVLSKVGLIACPVLILVDPNDHHLDPKGLDLLRDRLAGVRCEIESYENGQHELTLGPRSAEVIGDVRAFILGLCDQV